MEQIINYTCTCWWTIVNDFAMPASADILAWDIRLSTMKEGAPTGH